VTLPNLLKEIGFRGWGGERLHLLNKISVKLKVFQDPLGLCYRWDIS